MLKQFMFWKKKKEVKTQSKIVLGMIILEDENSFDLNVFKNDFKENYGYIFEPSGDNTSLAFKNDEEYFLIGHIPFPIPSGDIEKTAQYAYNWRTAIDDLQTYKSHLIISITTGSNDQVKRYRIFTQVLCSLLRSSNSVGVYQGTQSLLIPKKDYLSEAALMDDEYLPINLWIYFGLAATDNGNSGYTYGLKEFNKSEMEVIDSQKNMNDIRGFLFNMTHYVLDYDVTFNDGETCGLFENEKIAITLSKGKLINGDTLKLAY